MTRWITKAAGVNAAELAEVLETAARELRLLTSTGLRLWFGYQASPYPEGDGMQAVVRAESEGAALAILGDGWRVYELVPEGVPGVIAYGPTLRSATSLGGWRGFRLQPLRYRTPYPTRARRGASARPPR